MIYAQLSCLITWHNSETCWNRFQLYSQLSPVHVNQTFRLVTERNWASRVRLCLILPNRIEINRLGLITKRSVDWATFKLDFGSYGIYGVNEAFSVLSLTNSFMLSLLLALASVVLSNRASTIEDYVISYSHILIGSRLWSIKGQMYDWRHHYKIFPSAVLKWRKVLRIEIVFYVTGRKIRYKKYCRGK